MTETEEKGHFAINLGRQGGVFFLYVVILLGYYGIIANTVMFDQYGRWISFTEMDRTILFWTYQTYFSAILNPIIFISILIIIMVLIILFSLKEWHSVPFLIILISGLVVFISDIYWALIYWSPIFTNQGLALLLLFFICFVLSMKEDIPQYGIKASIWIVPFLITEGFIFYFIMFGFSPEPFIWQFMSPEGYLNILILILTTLAGSLSGMRFKQRRLKKKFSILE